MNPDVDAKDKTTAGRTALRSAADETTSRQFPPYVPDAGHSRTDRTSSHLRYEIHSVGAHHEEEGRCSPAPTRRLGRWLLINQRHPATALNLLSLIKAGPLPFLT